MVCLCWPVVVVVAYLCVPGRGSACWQSSVCRDLGSKGRTLQDCIHYCMSVIQTQVPELSSVDQKVSSDDDDGDLLLSIILALLTTEAELDAHGNQRRSYTMEHFRWGKPPGDKPAQPKQRAQRRSYTMEHFRWGKPSGEKIPTLKAHSNSRRSYSMEHFRWGKPPGRKRRPAKALASSDSSEGARWVQQMKRAQVRAKARDRKAGAYRMSHFRWGGSSASKRSDGAMEPWQEKLLLNMLRTVTAKDLQRRTGQTRRDEEEAGSAG